MLKDWLEDRLRNPISSDSDSPKIIILKNNGKKFAEISQNINVEEDEFLF